MSHHIYETEAFVLASQATGEANRLYFLFTPRWGLIGALAQGVRKIDSKLKFHLLDHSLIRANLVKGREFWRLTGSETILTAAAFGRKPKVRKLIARLFSLLKSLLAGPEESTALFSELRHLVEFLSRVELSQKQVVLAECLFLLKLLHYLGYLPEDQRFKLFINLTDWQIEALDQLEPLQGEVLNIINNFLSERGR